MTTDPLCGDPTCENPSCTQEAIDRWNRRMEQEAHDIVWGLLKSDDGVNP